MDLITFGALKRKIEAKTIDPVNDMPVVGARWNKNLSSPILTRAYSASGLTAVSGVGVAGSSGFDKINAFKLRLCNLSESGVVNAYFGDPTFKFDGTNGDVMVEIPKAYFKDVVDDVAGTREFIISDVPLSGFKLHPCFARKGKVQEKIYISAYQATWDGSKLKSVSGAMPEVSRDLPWFRTGARAKGASWSVMDLQVYDWITLLMKVEFATLNMQTAIGRGICDQSYLAADVATVAETAVSRIIVSNATAAKYLVGEYIGIGTTLGAQNIVKNRKITSIDVFDASNKAIVFDGAAANIAIGNIVYNSVAVTGLTDAIAEGTGRQSGIDGRTQIRYRGIEGIYAGMWQWLDNLNIRDNQGYTDPLCRHEAYVSTDFGVNYKALNAKFPTAEGYVKSFLKDDAIGLVGLPGSVGASSTTYGSDYYYMQAGDRAAFVGGYWINGSGAGPSCFYLTYAPSAAYMNLGARLLHIPQ